MTEDFLHYLWKYQNFRFMPLSSTSGRTLEVIKPGIHNDNSGPDFLEAHIRIDAEIWAGSVEIHILSSDWYRHGHQDDPAYDNVILHVVYSHDREVVMPSGNTITVLQLQNRFDELEYWRFEQLVQSKYSIPCSSHISVIDPLVIEKMLERAVYERMESKYSFISNLLTKNKNDWINTSYQLLAYGQGLKINSEAMLSLTRLIPYRILSKEAANRTRLEALLLGCAGLLNERDEYSKELTSCFRFMKSKYGLEEMPRSTWKYSRLRPSSFPERRIAQLAAIIFHIRDLPRELLEITNLARLREMLETELKSEYWLVHYRLGIKGRSKPIGFSLSAAWVDKLLINVIIPLRIAYAKCRSDTAVAESSFTWLFSIAGENNQIIRMMNELGLKLGTAGQTQGALHLYQSYCRPKKCLNCAIGNKILRSE